MSYKDTTCPCRDYLAGSVDLAAMDDQRLPVQARRSAAIRVLKLARGRHARLAM